MPGIQVKTGRMNREEMEALIREMEPLAVIDATHPYAEAVTENIWEACNHVQVKYIRLLREETPMEEMEGVRVFEDCETAAEWLDGQPGNILLTTGMKELPVFADGIRQKERIFARVLLQEDVFERMEELGLSRKQVICMQGPFTREMNTAMLQMVKGDFLVTKESGKNGGFSEKVEAARDAGAVCVVIRRPEQRDGYSPAEVQRLAVRLWKESRLEDRDRYRIPEWMNHGKAEETGTEESRERSEEIQPSEKTVGESSVKAEEKTVGESSLESEEKTTVQPSVEQEEKAAEEAEDQAAAEIRKTMQKLEMAGRAVVQAGGWMPGKRKLEKPADKKAAETKKAAESATAPGETSGETERKRTAGESKIEWSLKDIVSEDPAAGDEIRRKTITLLGIGMGNPDNMTVEGVKACRNADCIIGASRMLNALESFEKPMIPLSRGEEIEEFLLKHLEYSSVVIALSGDVGFYSGAKKLLERIQAEENLGRCQIRLLCGISSVAYLASRLQMPWEDMKLVSVHGREQNLAGAIQKNEKVFTLASDAASIRSIASKLDSLGLGEIEMNVGADLSYPTEQIVRGRVSDFKEFDRDGICAAVFCNPEAGKAVCVHGIPDDEFLRGKVPMTKEEVRSVSISKLQLTRDAVVYDVGAGTGSVSIECARMADLGKVYAIEWKEDAWKLVAENRKKFGITNLEIIPGRAPEALKELPAPTHAFIGGSSGSLKAILRTLVRKNPSVRIVVNCITLETITEVLEAAGDLELTIGNIVSVTAASAKTVGEHHMMMGQNPVYVITLWHERHAVPDQENG